MKCAYHIESIAIVNCAGCGKPLCRACDHRVKGFPFCQDCIVEGIDLLQRQKQLEIFLFQKKAPSPFASLVLSIICPGLGSAYNGQMLKALVYFSIFAGLFQLATLVSSPIFVFGFLGTWTLSIIDAWQTAKLIKLRTESNYPDEWFEKYFQNNPKIWGILLLITGLALLFQKILPDRFLGHFVLPAVLIGLGIYILQYRFIKKRSERADFNLFTEKVSFRTGEFEIKKDIKK